MSPFKTSVFMCLLLVAVTAASASAGLVGERPQIEYNQKVDGNRSACFSQRAYGADTINPEDRLLLGQVVKTESRQFGRWVYSVVTFEVSEVVLGSGSTGTIEFLTANTFALNGKGEAEMRESTVLPWVCRGDHALVLLRPNTVKPELAGWSELVYAGFLPGSDHSREQVIYHEGDVHYDAGGYLTALKAAQQASPYLHMRITRKAAGSLEEDIQLFREGLAARSAKEAGNE